jgi:hypothetical protein
VSSAAGGFVAGHRRTASGALIEVLDKMTGGALEMQQTTTDFLKDIQRQNQVIHQRMHTSCHGSALRIHFILVWLCKNIRVQIPRLIMLVFDQKMGDF